MVFDIHPMEFNSVIQNRYSSRAFAVRVERLVANEIDVYRCGVEMKETNGGIGCW